MPFYEAWHLLDSRLKSEIYPVETKTPPSIGTLPKYRFIKPLSSVKVNCFLVKIDPKPNIILLGIDDKGYLPAMKDERAFEFKTSQFFNL
ncbi:MAG: hypothetical protein ACI9BD_001609 [Candidatus Marinamargulisbacteria bacterium]